MRPERGQYTRDKYGPRSSLLAFKTKWRKKGQQSVSPRHRLGYLFIRQCRPAGAKEWKAASPSHSLLCGFLFFCPFRALSLLHPFPQGVALGWHITAPSGRKLFRRICYPPELLPPQPSNLLNCIAARKNCSFVLLSNSKEGAWWTLDNATEAYCYHNNMPLSSFSRDVSWYNLLFKII